DTPENSVMRSFDGGNSWLRTATGLPGVYEPFARVLGVSPSYADDGAIFTALSGQILGFPYHSLLRSYDHGASWVDLGPAPDNPDIFDIAITSSAGEGVVAHVATERGVWHFHAPCEQRIVNPGFEMNSGWRFPVTAYSGGYTTEEKHNGERSARLGIRSAGQNVRAYSSVQQTVTVPSDATRVILALWWRPSSGEGDLTTADEPSAAVLAAAAADILPDAMLSSGDRQYVLVLNEQGSVIERLLWTRSDLGEWQELTFDLSRYTGRQVQLHFGVYNDGLDGVTSMFVDEVTLTICYGDERSQQYLPLISRESAPTATTSPTPESTPTMTVTPTVTATPTMTITPTAAPIWPDPPAAIEVFSPVASGRYRSPVEITGLARTFQGAVYLSLLDADGVTIAQHWTHGGLTSYEFFHGYLRFETTVEMSATLLVYEASGADQPPLSSVAIPIVIEPGQRLVDLNAPASGAIVCGRIPVAGYSNTFEANVVVELTDRDESLLERKSAMGGTFGIYGEFSNHFDYTATVPQAALVGAREDSPRDGSAVDHTRVPVTLYPAGHSACQ
ncbi:MAG: Gmad2 immunoglobulin-like domain-containing protein, partial [Caldilinea sp.]